MSARCQRRKSERENEMELLHKWKSGVYGSLNLATFLQK